MTRNLRGNAIALAFALLFVVPAYAQPGGPQAKPEQTMHGMDSQTMMNQCAQMRREMKPGSSMSPDMQGMMAQCDQMNNTPGNPSGPRPRTR